VEGTDERNDAVTIALSRDLSRDLSRAPDAPATETPHEHESTEPDDVCAEDCCIAAAVIPAEGVE
jgi:hypothetical protein